MRRNQSHPPGRVQRVGRVARQVIVTTIGAVVVVIGIALLVLPGPGLLVLAAGLAILATEYRWARRLYVRTRDRSRRAYAAARSRSARDRAAADPEEGPAASPPRPTAADAPTVIDLTAEEDPPAASVEETGGSEVS